MPSDTLNRLSELLRMHGCQAALLSNPFTLTWLTGYAPPIETGPDPFAGSSALGWLHDGELTLILSDGEAGNARAAGAAVQEYAGYTIDQPLDVVQRQADALRTVLAKGGSHAGTIAIEHNSLIGPMLAAQHLAHAHVTLRPLDDEIAALRAVKTPDEIAKLRAAFRLCDLAQAHMRNTVRVGVTELELWGSMRAQVEAAAGGRVPCIADVVGGARAGEIGGPPSSYALRAGDSFIFDFVPRLNGYWGDCCATYFAGEPSAELRRIRQIALDALNRGIEMLRPGLRARDLDAMLRKTISDAGYTPYPHHSGHGVGASYHEEPRIVPYNDLLLEPGMVVMLEPGIYLPGVGGARMEDALLVTADGCEVLTRHLHR